jgi:tetratricopeptide (TPR) repeat protein
MRLKDHKQAAADLEKALRISAEKDNISIRYELGKAYLVDWKLEKAIEQFDRVLEKDAENGLALANRGVAHREAGYLKEAERDFQMALELVKARSRKDKVRRLLKETQKILLGPFRFFDRFYKDNKGSDGQRGLGRDLW